MSEVVRIEEFQGELVPVTDSLRISEVLGKDHPKVMRDIRELIEKLSSEEETKSVAQSNFGQCSYVNSNNREMPMYLMTKEGFENLMFTYNGTKMVVAKAKFIRKFHDMEKELKNPFSNMSKELQAIFMVDKKQQEQEQRILNIEDKMTVNYELAENLRSAINIRAVELLGGKDAEAYKKLNKKLYASFHRDIKRTFKVNSYKNLSVKNYDLAINFIEGWEPKDEILKYAIDGLNSQIQFA